MEENVLRQFYFEIRLQCRFCKYAYEDIQRLVPTGNNRRVLYSIQGFLVSCANISKILFPIDWKKDTPEMRKRKDERGGTIRKNLSVDENSILKDRKFRDHFEHYDERIEEWYASNPDKTFVDLFMGSLDEVKRSFPTIDVDRIHRNYDPHSETITFQGKRYELKPVIGEINRLSDVVQNVIGENLDIL